MPDAARLASACALVGVDAHVVPLEKAGSAVVPVPGADATEAAARLSRVLGRADILALQHADGQVRAQRWQRGAVRETPPAGLAMARVPDVVERLLLGGDDPSGVEGAVSSVGLPRVAAARTTLGGAARFQRWDRISTVVLLVVALVLAAVESPRALAGNGSWVVVVGSLLLVVWTAVRMVRARP